MSAGHRPILPAGCSPFLHLARAALPDAVGAIVIAIVVVVVVVIIVLVI